jgi:hypothetical protein
VKAGTSKIKVVIDADTGPVGGKLTGSGEVPLTK